MSREKRPSSIDISTRLPKKQRDGSILFDETTLMDRNRRIYEQEGHRKKARVHAREHATEQAPRAPEGELQNSIQEHPAFADKQQFDGCDPNITNIPNLNTDARTKWDNENTKQQAEKAYRLNLELNPTNAPSFSPSPLRPR